MNKEELVENYINKIEQLLRSLRQVCKTPELVDLVTMIETDYIPGQNWHTLEPPKDENDGWHFTKWHGINWGHRVEVNYPTLRHIVLMLVAHNITHCYVKVGNQCQADWFMKLDGEIRASDGLKLMYMEENEKCGQS